MTAFLWIPGLGIDAAALQRMRRQLPRPKQPMGEAWFMGKTRRMFGELLGDLDRLPVEQLEKPLEEIAGGTAAFGPRREWTLWYHHLLAAILPRCHECHVEPLLEHLVTGFITLYPAGIAQAPYAAFAEDALLTLGRAMMEPQCWREDQIAVGAVLKRSPNPSGVWHWYDASGDLSSSLFFCLKYLPAPAVPGWFRSVLRIPSPQWRAQLIVWLVGAHHCLLTGCWPAGFGERAYPSVKWAWSHGIEAELDPSGAPFLPEASRQAALGAVRAYFSAGVYLQWLESIAAVPGLEAELAAIPASFEQLYLRPQ